MNFIKMKQIFFNLEELNGEYLTSTDFNKSTFVEEDKLTLSQLNTNR